MARVPRPKLVVALLMLLVIVAASSASLIPIARSQVALGGVHRATPVAQEQIAPARDTTRTWEIVPSPDPRASVLLGVSCVTPTHCVAVGQYGENDGRNLVESWNGTKWSVVANPHGYALIAVSCATSDFCVAVGQRYVGQENQMFIESWNGKRWSITPSPDDATNALYAVTCISTSNCEAVGSRVSNNQGLALVENWNGSSWRVVRSPSTDENDVLTGVSCVSPASCMTVGWYSVHDEYFGTLVEHWDGRSWSIVSNIRAKSYTEEMALSGVSCSDSTSCMAVGDHTDSSEEEKILIERWNGTSWSIVPSSQSGVIAGLSSASCSSSRKCIAVGSYYAGGTLIESWNGTSWSIVPSRNEGHGAVLGGVSCPTVTDCVAVGSYSHPGDTSNTLVESS